MILQEEFKKSGYKDILVGDTASEYEIDLEDIFELNHKPEELLSIFISEQRDELFFLLDGDLEEIDSLCDCWDDRIRVFTIINGKSKALHKLKYNIVQLIVYSEDTPDKSREGNLLISRKIIIKGDMADKEQIVIDDDEVIELPLLSSEGYNTEKIYTKSIAKLAKEKQELFGVYISMYCEGSEYEHSNRGKVTSFREAILDEYDTDAVFKIELGKSDLTIWKQVFNFALLNVFYSIDALHSRIESRDKHLFDAGMISEQAMARTLYMIKELTDKLDAYGVELS